MDKFNKSQHKAEQMAELRIIRDMPTKQQKQFLEMSKMRIENRGGDTSVIDKLINAKPENRAMMIDKIIDPDPEEMSPEEYYENKFTGDE